MYFNLTFESFIYSISIIMGIILAVVVYRRNPQSATNRLFSVYCALVIAWLVALYISFLPSSLLFSTLTWIRLSMALAAMSSTALLIFTYVFPERKNTFPKKWSYLLIFFAAVLSLLCLSPFVFSQLEITGNIPNPTPGPGLIIFNLYGIGATVLGVYFLFKKYKMASGIIRSQLLLVLFGLVLMYAMVIFTVALPVLFFGYQRLVPYHGLYALIFLTASAFAIIRYRLMDIRVIFRKSIITTSILVIPSVIVIVLLLVLKNVATAFTNIPDDWLLLFSVVVLLLIFPKLRGGIQTVVDRFIFTNAIDLSTKIQEFEQTTRQSGTIDLVSKQIAKFIGDNLHILDVHLLVYDYRAKDRLVGRYPNYGEPILYLNEPLVNLCKTSNTIIIRQELDSKVDCTDLEKQAKNKLHKLDAEVVVSIGEKGQCDGVLLLGTKQDGSALAEEEIATLQQLAKYLGYILPQTI